MSAASSHLVTVTAAGRSVQGKPAPEYVNLTPDQSGALVPVGERYDTSPHPQPEGYMTDYCIEDGSMVTLVARGREVGQIAGGEYSAVTTVDADLRCAVTVGRYVVLMTADGPRLLRRNDNAWLYLGEQPEWPGVRFEAVYAGTMHVDIPQCQLSGVDLRGATLSSSAVSELSRSTLSSYLRLSDEAAAAGLFIQPVIARYIVRGVGGYQLFSSGPVVVALPDGWQCSKLLRGSLTSVTEGSATLGPIRLEADTFTVRAIVGAIDPASPWSEIIASVELQLSPQLHPVDLTSCCEWRIEGGSSQEPLLSVALPGATRGLSADLTARYRVLSGIMGRLDTVLTSVHRVLPLSAIALRSLPGPSHGKAADECATLVAALKKPVSYSPGEFPVAMLRRCSSPHSFTAGTVCASGDVVVWGDVTPLWFRGYDPRLWACATADGDWRMSVAVTFYDDTRRTAVYECLGSGYCPVAFSPLLSYPDPEARLLTVYLEHDEAVVTRSFSLTPSADGSCAWYVDPSLLPLSLLDDGISVPVFMSETHTRLGQRSPELLLGASAHSPLVPCSALKCGSAPVCAITPAVRSQSSWDFARTHLYAFSASGIYAVAIHSSRRLAAATIIDPRGVASARDVRYYSDGIMVNASDGTLLRVTGARTVEVDPPAAVSVDPSGRIRWSVRIPVARRHAMRVLRIDMVASQFSGAVVVSADDGVGFDHSLPVVTLAIDGPVNAPVYARFAVPARAVLSVTVEAAVSSDFRLSCLYLS